MQSRIRARKIFRALYALGALALALLVFWPKVSISMEPRDEKEVIWLYTLRNDSLLPISDLTKQKTVFEHTVKPCLKRWSYNVGTAAEMDNACGVEHVSALRSGDEHTFRCMVPTLDPPTDQIGGELELRVDYRYLRIFHASTAACFEYAPKADGSPRYIRRSCATPARTLPYAPC